MRNNVMLTGYTTSEPKVFVNKDDSKKVFLTIGISAEKKDKTGKEITNFINVEALIKAGVTNDPLTKLKTGDLIEVDAEMRSFVYEKDGEKHYGQTVFVTKCRTLRKKA